MTRIQAWIVVAVLVVIALGVMTLVHDNTQRDAEDKARALVDNLKAEYGVP
jgi:hypothetical protein